VKIAALIEYIKDTAKIDSIRPKHREYLGSLLATGKLAVSGPLMDGYGALIVYEADSVAAAESLLKGDPFHENGVFVRWELHPWKVVFTNPETMSKTD
jgi:uncharacterized protein